MPGYYEVLNSQNTGQRQSPNGPLVKFSLSLKDDQGQVTHSVYTQKKPGNEAQVAVGQKVYGRIEEGEYGPRFFGEDPSQVDYSSQAPPAPQQQTPDPTFTQPAPPSQSTGFDNIAARTKSIEMQAMYKAAAPIVAAEVAAGRQVDPLQRTKELANHFAADVAHKAQLAGGAL